MLAFPGVFRGALDAGARRITENMMVAAAEAIFSVVSDDLAADRIVRAAGRAGREAVTRRSPGAAGTSAFEGSSFGRLSAALLTAATLAVVPSAGCSTDLGDQRVRPEVVVGFRADPESMLLAGVYVAALRSYGFAARPEAAADPMAKLNWARSPSSPCSPARHCNSCSPARWRCPTPRSSAR